MSAQPPLYGLMAEFDDPDDLLAAARRAREAGYRRMDAYSPFPVEGLAEALDFRNTRVPEIVLAGGLVGGVGGFFMQWFATRVFYPLNVGGRPLNSWPAYIPITFELTVLLAAFAALFGMLLLNGLPQPDHPVFNAPAFQLASRDRFFLCIEANDPRFDRAATTRFLLDLRPLRVEEVAW
ncbi:MAG TPA: DUF3341 domain-containing protein [Thermomicrobiales bacterium]|nr:DUF3341 domain-containing protein [Thermomicrobiales bacterium]